MAAFEIALRTTLSVLACLCLLLPSSAGADYTSYLQSLGSGAYSRAAWHLNETSGTSAAAYWDTASLTYTGTYTNSPTLGAAGPASVSAGNNAVTCDGSNDYVVVPDKDGASFVNNDIATSLFTFLIWVKPTGTASGMVASKAGSAGKYEWGLTCAATCSVTLWNGNGGATYMTTGNTTSSLSTSAWSMLAWTFTGSVPRVSIFFNGTQENTSTSTSGSSVAATDTLDFCRRGDNLQYWAGSIDEPALFGGRPNLGSTGAVLTQSELQTLYALGTGAGGAVIQRRMFQSKLAPLAPQRLAFVLPWRGSRLFRPGVENLSPPRFGELWRQAMNDKD